MALQSETLSLGGASAVHLLAHDGTGGAVGGGGQLLERHRRHFDMQIDAVEERTTYPTHVTLDLRWSALARPLPIAEVAARTRIHRGDENEAGGEGAARQGARDGDLALFQRLPHHLQALAIELRQFVEEKDAVVSQADLAGRQGWQDRRQPLRQHRLAPAGRTDHQYIVASAGGDDERTFREFLTADIAKVDFIGIEASEQLVDTRGDRLGGELAREDADRLSEAADGVDSDILDDSRLAGVGGGHKEFRDLAFGGGHRDRQGALDGADAAVEGQFADRGEIAQLFGQELAGRDEQAQRDRQVEPTRVFSEVCRREVDHGAAGVAVVAEVDEGTLDTMDTLLDGHLGQAHQDDFREARGGIDFHLDRQRIDPDESEGVQLGEHE